MDFFVQLKIGLESDYQINCLISRCLGVFVRQILSQIYNEMGGPVFHPLTACICSQITQKWQYCRKEEDARRKNL